jgi:hypothetical protein
MGYKYSPYMFTGDMFIKQSFDGGATWDSAMVLTDSHYVWMGSNYIKDSLMVITWQDLRFGGNNDEVMVRYSTDYGIAWSDESRLSYGDYHSDSPIACATGDKIHVLWGDARAGASGLYYSFNELYNNIDDDTIPIVYSQLTAYPNPFNSSINFEIPQNEAGPIKIYNVAGQLVRTLKPKGKENIILWDGADNKGRSLSSGIYLVTVQKGSGIISAKIAYLK